MIAPYLPFNQVLAFWFYAAGLVGAFVLVVASAYLPLRETP